MKKLRKILKKKRTVEKEKFKILIPSSPFGVPEHVYSKLQGIYLILTGSSYPSGPATDDTIQTLLVAIENYVGIASAFSVGTFSIPEDVKDRLRVLHTKIGGGSYSKGSADAEALYKVLDNTVFPSYILGHWKLDESSGIAASDSSWHVRNGTLVNGPTWVAGKLSNAIRFSVATPNQHVNFGNIANFERTDSFSVECWFKTTAAGLCYVISKFNPALLGWAISIWNTGRIQFFMGGSTMGHWIRKYTNVAYNDDNWHHLIITYNGTSLASGVKIYIDGNDEVCTVASDSLDRNITNTNNFYLATRTALDYPYVGYLDEIIIYSEVLSLSEVQYRYNSGSGRDNFER